MDKPHSDAGQRPRNIAATAATPRNRTEKPPSLPYQCTEVLITDDEVQADLFYGRDSAASLFTWH